jgi:hypothetical protein
VGAIYADIELTNEDDLAAVHLGVRKPEDVRRVTVAALADSGATILVIPDTSRATPGLAQQGRRPVGIADGSIQECDLVGPVQVRFGDRDAVGRAIAIAGGSQVLLGATQMEEMDFVIDPRAQKLIPNPESPDRARLLAVGHTLYGPPSGATERP